MVEQVDHVCIRQVASSPLKPDQIVRLRRGHKILQISDKELAHATSPWRSFARSERRFCLPNKFFAAINQVNSVAQLQEQIPRDSADAAANVESTKLSVHS